MESPRHLRTCPDRDLDCQMALEDDFARLVRNLSVLGDRFVMAEENAAKRVARVLDHPEEDLLIAEVFQQMRARAGVTDWEEGEIDRALHDLAKAYQIPAGVPGD